MLAQNSGYDPQETLVKVQAEHVESGQLTGVDLNTGKDSLSHRVMLQKEPASALKNKVL